MARIVGGTNSLVDVLKTPAMPAMLASVVEPAVASARAVAWSSPALTGVLDAAQSAVGFGPVLDAALKVTLPFVAASTTGAAAPPMPLLRYDGPGLDEVVQSLAALASRIERSVLDPRETGSRGLTTQEAAALVATFVAVGSVLLVASELAPEAFNRWAAWLGLTIAVTTALVQLARRNKK